jgi:hypothetical protein
MTDILIQELRHHIVELRKEIENLQTANRRLSVENELLMSERHE